MTDTRQLKHFHTPAGPLVRTATGHGRAEVIVLCSNNYLGLANRLEVDQAGSDGLKKSVAGTASVRFISGTLACHRETETAIGRFVGTRAEPTSTSCWSANE